MLNMNKFLETTSSDLQLQVYNIMSPPQEVSLKT
jgi:hypothetical protein